MRGLNFTLPLHQGLEGVLRDPWIDRNIERKSGIQIKVKLWFVNYTYIVTKNGSKKLRDMWM